MPFSEMDAPFVSLGHRSWRIEMPVITFPRALFRLGRYFRFHSLTASALKEPIGNISRGGGREGNEVKIVKAKSRCSLLRFYNRGLLSDFIQPILHFRLGRSIGQSWLFLATFFKFLSLDFLLFLWPGFVSVPKTFFWKKTRIGSRRFFWNWTLSLAFCEGGRSKIGPRTNFSVYSSISFTILNGHLITLRNRNRSN